MILAPDEIGVWNNIWHWFVIFAAYPHESGRNVARWAFNFWRKWSTHGLVGTEQLDQTSGSQPAWMARLAQQASPARRTVFETWRPGMARTWQQQPWRRWRRAWLAEHAMWLAQHGCGCFGKQSHRAFRSPRTQWRGDLSELTEEGESLLFTHWCCFAFSWRNLKLADFFAECFSFQRHHYSYSLLLFLYHFSSSSLLGGLLLSWWLFIVGHLAHEKASGKPLKTPTPQHPPKSGINCIFA